MRIFGKKAVKSTPNCKTAPENPLAPPHCYFCLLL